LTGSVLSATRKGSTGSRAKTSDRKLNDGTLLTVTGVFLPGASVVAG
jgi:hypothetical protein